MRNLILLSALLTLVGCAGSGGSSESAAKSPAPSPVVTQSQLTYHQGIGFACLLDQESDHSSLWCWGTSAYFPTLNSTPKEYVRVNRVSGIQFLVLWNDMICAQVNGQFPVAGGQGVGTLCFGRSNVINTANLGGQTYATSNFHYDAQTSVLESPFIAMDTGVVSFSNLNPFNEGNNAVVSPTETCDVTGNDYVCPSFSVTLQ